MQLAYAKLVSPIDGVTGIRQVDVGNIIHPTDPNGLVVVTEIAPISVIFALPETDLSNIQQQMTKGSMAVLAYSQDNSVKLGEGTLGLIDNEILQTTGTIRLKADFPNRDHLLWPGELINVRLLLRTEQDGLTVAARPCNKDPTAPTFTSSGRMDQSKCVLSRRLRLVTSGSLSSRASAAARQS